MPVRYPAPAQLKRPAGANGGGLKPRTVYHHYRGGNQAGVMLQLRTPRPASPGLRASARGLVASMAMTGMRAVTANTRLVHKSPPEAIVDRHAPRAIQQMSSEHRAVLTELAHWAYGSAGGWVFGRLPARLRTHPAAGPGYGLAVWLGFELAIAPLLGVSHVRHAPLLGRILVALDHVLYGVVVAGRLAPEDRFHPRRWR
jgi:hypothetical protein